MPSKFMFETENERKKREQVEHEKYLEEQRENEQQRLNREKKTLSIANRISPIVVEIMEDYLTSRFSLKPIMGIHSYIGFDNEFMWCAKIKDKVIGHRTGYRDYGSGEVEVTWEIIESYELHITLRDTTSTPNLFVIMYSYRDGERDVVETTQELFDVLQKQTCLKTTGWKKRY